MIITSSFIQRLAWRAAAIALCSAAPLGAVLAQPAADSGAAPKPFEAYAQQTAQVRYLDIDSQVLGERRTIAISLPDSYDSQPGQRYPVLLLLDGPAQLAHTESLVRFLARGEKVPEMIIVAVANTQRSRDLTPPLPVGAEGRGPLSRSAPSGGADAFLAFLSDELLPTVDQRYRTAPWRALLGHSFGGLFGLHALVQKPELFRAYLLASPSLWWGDGDIRRRAQAAWPSLQRLPGDRWVYFTSGDGEKTIEDSVNAFEALLKRLPAAQPSGLHWVRDRLPGDDHGTTPHLTWLNGLRLAFADWPYDMPERATPADYTAYLAHRHQRSVRYGVDVAPSVFELTHFAVAHARAAQPRQALALACQLAERRGPQRTVFGPLSRIGGALADAGAASRAGARAGAAGTAAAAEAAAAARTVYALALAHAADADTTPEAVERVRQRAQGAGQVDTAAACADSAKGSQSASAVR